MAQPLEAYRKRNGDDTLVVTYYPGMIELYTIDAWHEHKTAFNMHILDWRALNVAVEACHNGENV